MFNKASQEIVITINSNKAFNWQTNKDKSHLITTQKVYGVIAILPHTLFYRLGFSWSSWMLLQSRRCKLVWLIIDRLNDWGRALWLFLQPKPLDLLDKCDVMFQINYHRTTIFSEGPGHSNLLAPSPQPQAGLPARPRDCERGHLTIFEKSPLVSSNDSVVFQKSSLRLVSAFANCDELWRLFQYRNFLM